MNKIFFSLLLFSSQAGQAQIADSSKRHVPTQGAANFRDLGGYATTDGHHVKWKSLYRSADISKLTDADLDLLKNKHINYVVDFRGVEESKKAPDRLNPGVDYILCPAGSDNNLTEWMKALTTIKTREGGDSMIKIFYAQTEFFAPRYKPFFDKLLDLPGDQSLLFHCTAGKDRTGIGAALLLYALGVPYETIVHDYTATNYYRQAENEKMTSMMVQGMHMNEEVAKSIMGARPEYLATTFAAINKEYGSVDNFLKGPLGLDEEKMKQLRSKFLE